MLPSKVTVLGVLLTFTISSCQLTNTNNQPKYYQYQGPLQLSFQPNLLQQQQVDARSAIPCESSNTPEPIVFPSNSTPLFNYETPYKQVSGDLPENRFTEGVPAEDSELVFDILADQPVLNSVAGTVENGDSRSWPHLKGKSLSMKHWTFPPCGTAVPHYHTSDEINFVIKGSNITVGIKEPLKPLDLLSNVKIGQVIFVPKGYIHFLINYSCTESGEAVQVFTDEKSPAFTVGAMAADLTLEILHAAFNAEASVLKELQANVPHEAELLRLSSYCLKQCGL